MEIKNLLQRAIDAVSSTPQVDEGPKVIDSIAKAEYWLEDLDVSSQPSLTQVIKTQLSILKTVQSPTMTGMMIDNIVLCLDKSLKSAGEEEKEKLREIFAQMIQNHLFLAEAKLKFAMDRNKETAAILLQSCGDMFSETFGNIASLAASQGTGKVRFANLFATKEVQKGFFSNLGAWINGKKVLEESKKEFLVLVDDLFKTLDKYQYLFGPSIVINGLLSKYKRVLIDGFTEEKMAPVKNRLTQGDVNMMNSLVDEVSTSISDIGLTGLTPMGIFQTASKLVSSVSKFVIDKNVKKKAAELDVHSFCTMCNAYSSHIVEMKKLVAEEENKLAELCNAKEEIGFFKFGQKAKANEKIEEQKAILDGIKEKLDDSEEKLRQLKEKFPEADSIKQSIDEYSAELERIEAKYAVTI